MVFSLFVLMVLCVVDFSLVKLWGVVGVWLFCRARVRMVWCLAWRER